MVLVSAALKNGVMCVEGVVLQVFSTPLNAAETLDFQTPLNSASVDEAT